MEGHKVGFPGCFVCRADSCLEAELEGQRLEGVSGKKMLEEGGKVCVVDGEEKEMEMEMMLACLLVCILISFACWCVCRWSGVLQGGPIKVDLYQLMGQRGVAEMKTVFGGVYDFLGEDVERSVV